MSIVTKRGDEGQTDLAGRVRISKGSLRVECYGTVDELVAQLGLARAMLPDTEVGDEVRAIQKVLFRICASLATVDASSVERPSIDPSLIDTLDRLVSRIESAMVEKPDWSVAGEQPGTAALDVARTVCRRAERHAVRLTDAGEDVDPNALVYLNRLSDALWLMARHVEQQADIDARLRGPGESGKPWSPAW